MGTSKIVVAVCSAFLVIAPCTLSACGGPKTSSPKMAAVQPGNMPSGAVWDGVYFNAVWGNLHIVSDGNSFEGRWLRTDESAWGEMKGTLSGDVARFEWKEHKIGMVGPSATSTGKGYFRYTRPEGDNMDDRILGEWGFGDAEVGGGEWDSVKQRNKQPDLKSVGG
ncbi:MAG TPA: hypothetical protein PLV85_24800, partial [Polyangiaceae bacterium]|nr:hypothetical protein [Polyangiaceae bacterium]